MNKSRVEAFSDGVFAIAITLLVLTIAQPTDFRFLAAQLGDRWPGFAAFVVSFAVIGIMWLNHHSVFSHFERLDRGMVYLNMFLLLTITFLPYPTGVLGEALAKHRGTQTAAVVYAVTMAVNACAWAALWLYGSRRPHLLRTSFPAGERELATLLFTGGVVVYLVSVGIAVWNAYVFLAVQAGLAVYYAIDPVNRRPGRGGRPGRGDLMASGDVAGGGPFGAAAGAGSESERP